MDWFRAFEALVMAVAIVGTAVGLVIGVVALIYCYGPVALISIICLFAVFLVTRDIYDYNYD